MGGGRPSQKPKGKVTKFQRVLQFVYSVSNVSNAALGSGALAFPLAFSLMGWVAALIVTLLAAALNGYMLTVVVKCARYTSSSSYSEMCELMFGRWAGRVVLLSASLFCYSCMLSYLLVFGDMIAATVGDLIPSLMHTVWTSPYFVTAVVWVIVQPLCFVRSIDFLGPAAFLGVVAVVYTVAMLVVHSFTSTTKPAWSELEMYKLKPSAFQAVPIILFAFMCHMTVVPATSSLKYYYPSTKPSTSTPKITSLLRPSSGGGGGGGGGESESGSGSGGGSNSSSSSSSSTFAYSELANSAADVAPGAGHTRGGAGGAGEEDDPSSYAYSFGPEDGLESSLSSSGTRFVSGSMEAEEYGGQVGSSSAEAKKARWWAWSSDNLSLGASGPGGRRAPTIDALSNFQNGMLRTPPMASAAAATESLARYRTLVAVCGCVMLICCGMYVPIGMGGYVLFGDKVDGDVMLSFGDTPPLDVKIGRLCMALTVVLGYPTVVFIGRDAVADALGLATRAPALSLLWIVLTAIFSTSALGISMILRYGGLNIGFVLSFIGSTSGVLIQFGMPALMLVRLGNWVQGYLMVALTACVMTIGLFLTFASAICPHVADDVASASRRVCDVVGY